MNRKRKFRSKRGFSDIVASLILMLLAVAAGVVVYGYLMGWIGGATTNPRMTGHLSFDTTYANVTGNSIILAVRNVGGTSIVLANVYVTGIDRTINCSITPSPSVNNTATLNSTGYTLLVQQVATINCTYAGMLTGTYYTVQVACKDGTTISQAVPAQ
jgi:hypothetical protein